MNDKEIAKLIKNLENYYFKESYYGDAEYAMFKQVRGLGYCALEIIEFMNDQNNLLKDQNNLMQEQNDLLKEQNKLLKEQIAIQKQNNNSEQQRQF